MLVFLFLLGFLSYHFLFTPIFITKVIYFYKMRELNSFILTIFVCVLYHFLKRKTLFWYKMKIDCSV